jgi:hypothetical protein
MTEPHDEQDASAPVAVEELESHPETTPTKEDLTRTYNDRQQHVTRARQRVRELEGQAATQGISLDETDELLRLEKWIALEEPHLERLQVEITRAAFAFDLDAAKDNHDAHIPEKRAWYPAFAAWLGAGYDLMDEFLRIDRAQKGPLTTLIPPEGGPPFAQVGSEEVLQNVLSRAPNAGALLEVLTGPRLTVGDLESMQDVDPGCREISERAMRRFVEGRKA